MDIEYMSSESVHLKVWLFKMLNSQRIGSHFAKHPPFRSYYLYNRFKRIE